MARYEGPEYPLSERYGALFNMVFSIFLYTPGLPFMWIYASIYFVVNFWADKSMLLLVFKKPTAYDEKLAELANNLMPQADCAIPI